MLGRHIISKAIMERAVGALSALTERCSEGSLRTLWRWALAAMLCLPGGCTLQRSGGAFPEKGSSLVRCQSAERIARHAAIAASVDLELVMGVMRVESFFHRRAKSRVGALGLMQIMPATGKGFQCGDLLDPRENIYCGARILQRLLKRYSGDEIFALGAYNGGPGYVRKARKTKKPPPNLRYAEHVLLARTRYIKGGCKEVVRPLPR